MPAAPLSLGVTVAKAPPINQPSMAMFNRVVRRFARDVLAQAKLEGRAGMSSLNGPIVFQPKNFEDAAAIVRRRGHRLSGGRFAGLVLSQVVAAGAGLTAGFSYESTQWSALTIGLFVASIVAAVVALVVGR